MTARVPGTYKRRLYAGLPKIDDDLPDEIKDALAIHNSTAIKGECSYCGARPEFGTDPESGLPSITFVHTASCGIAALFDEDEESD